MNVTISIVCPSRTELEYPGWVTESEFKNSVFVYMGVNAHRFIGINVLTLMSPAEVASFRGTVKTAIWNSYYYSENLPVAALWFSRRDDARPLKAIALKYLYCEIELSLISF